MRHNFIDKYAYQTSIIHKIHPTIKFFIFLFLSLTITLLNVKTSLLICLLILLLIIGKLANIPAVFIIKRLLVVLPFILIIFLTYEVTLKFQFSTSNTILKSFVIILALIIFSQTTKFNDFIKTLKTLKFPKILLLLISFIYRYVFLLTDEYEKLTFSIKLRMRKKLTLSLLTCIGSVLLLRTYERAEKVNKAMILRGWGNNNEYNKS